LNTDEHSLSDERPGLSDAIQPVTVGEFADAPAVEFSEISQDRSVESHQPDTAETDAELRRRQDIDLAERFGAENVRQLRELAENRLRTIDRDLTDEEKQTLLAEILLEAGISPRDQPTETSPARGFLRTALVDLSAESDNEGDVL
jgi:hypothetical protein